MSLRFPIFLPRLLPRQQKTVARYSSDVTSREVWLVRRQARASSKRRLKINVHVHHQIQNWGPSGPKWFWEDRGWISREWMMTRDPANNAMHLLGIIVNITGWFGLALAVSSFFHSRKTAREHTEDDLFHRHLGFLHIAEDRIDDHGIVLDGNRMYFAHLRNDPIYRAELLRRRRRMLKNADIDGAGEEHHSNSENDEALDMGDIALHDMWYQLKLQGDPKANEVDRDRRKMKNFFNVAFRTWKHNPAPRHRAELQTYLHEAWSQHRVKQFLELIVAMDKAAVRAQNQINWKDSRPQLYDFIALIWACSESNTSLEDSHLVHIEVGKLPLETVLDKNVCVGRDFDVT